MHDNILSREDRATVLRILDAALIAQVEFNAYTRGISAMPAYEDAVERLQGVLTGARDHAKIAAQVWMNEESDKGHLKIG